VGRDILTLGEGFNTQVITLRCFYIVGREIWTLGEGFNTQVITLWCFYSRPLYQGPRIRAETSATSAERRRTRPGRPAGGTEEGDESAVWSRDRAIVDRAGVRGHRSDVTQRELSCVKL
jgi:hypothetical protein